MSRFTERNKIIGAAPPKDYNAAAMTAKYVSLKDYGHLTIVIHSGAWAGGTAAVSLLQATDVSAGSAKALGMTYQYTGTAASGLLTKTAVLLNTFNISVANTMHIIEIENTDLDASNGFDCVTLVIATPGANNDFYNVDYILSEPRNPKQALLTAILD